MQNTGDLRQTHIQNLIWNAIKLNTGKFS